jgi:hypothetical protein
VNNQQNPYFSSIHNLHTNCNPEISLQEKVVILKLSIQDNSYSTSVCSCVCYLSALFVSDYSVENRMNNEYGDSQDLLTGSRTQQDSKE